MGLINFFKNAFSDMKKSAKKQHELDKAEFAAVKAESRASFEENRGTNTFKRAKEDSKKVWDEAHLSPAERAEKADREREEKIAEAKEREEAAKARLEEARVNKGE